MVIDSLLAAEGVHFRIKRQRFENRGGTWWMTTTRNNMPCIGIAKDSPEEMSQNSDIQRLQRDVTREISKMEE